MGDQTITLANLSITSQVVENLKLVLTVSKMATSPATVLKNPRNLSEEEARVPLLLEEVKEEIMSLKVEEIIRAIGPLETISLRDLMMLRGISQLLLLIRMQCKLILKVDGASPIPQATFTLLSLGLTKPLILVRASLVHGEILRMNSGEMQTLTKMMEETLLLDQSDQTEEAIGEEEEAWGEDAEAEEATWNALNANRQATFLETAPTRTHPQEEVEEVKAEDALNATKKATLQKNVLTQQVTMEAEAEAGVEVEEATKPVTDATKRDTCHSSAPMRATVTDPTSDRGETAVAL